MVFASLNFLYLFLPLNLILYHYCKKREHKNIVLLIFSLFFYAWGEPLCVLLLLFSASLDYLCAGVIEMTRGTPTAKAALLTSVCINLGLLAVFKYSGFLVSNLNAVTGLKIPVPQIALPLGISFYTFQTMTYVIDVYRGDIHAQRKYTNYLMYLTMYPQLVAGPIVRYADVEAEINDRRITWRDMADGLFRFCVGLGKKVILANACGKLVDTYMGGDASGICTLGAWFGVFMYTMQIYFDFSAYSDMAIGLGRFFGFRFPENFNYPYVSQSVSEFWRRWHMTLGNFFRNYVYIPLGGNRRHLYRNLLIVWFLTGLWHGASWNFILWGLYFGLLIVFERLWFGKKLEAARPWVRHLYSMAAVCFGWVLFYFDDMHKMGAFLKSLLFFGGGFSNRLFWGDFVGNIVFFIVAVTACLPVVPWLKKRLSVNGKYRNPNFVLGFQIVWSLLLLLFSTALLVGASYNPFLYFRF